MRIRLIALIAGLSLCSSALAQEESAPPAAEPAAEPAAASPAPAPAADTTEKAPAPAARPAAPRPSKPAASARPARVPSSLESDPEAAARAFFQALLSRNFVYLVDVSRTPFQFEGRTARTTTDLQHGWASVLTGQPFQSATLYGIEMFTPEAAIARFGPMPEKLAGWQAKGGMISVGNIDGRAVFVLWRKAGQGWAAYGIHD